MRARVRVEVTFLILSVGFRGAAVSKKAPGKPLAALPLLAMIYRHPGAGRDPGATQQSD